MGENSKIQWTDNSFNPWIGCTKISEACKFCYAEQWANRYGHATWGDNGSRNKTADANWKNPYKWNRQANKEGVRRRVFCSSLADVFENHPQIKQEWRDELFKIIKLTTNLDWLLLTKRPENFSKYLPSDYIEGYANVWLGCSIENKKRMEERMDFLINTPAHVHFVSAEPFLEYFELPEHGLDWLIIGGESGPVTKIRKMELSHVKRMIDQAKEKGIKVFFKQLGSVLSKEHKLADGHGGNFDQYTELLNWLKVREIPDSHPSFSTLFKSEHKIENEQQNLNL